MPERGQGLDNGVRLGAIIELIPGCLYSFVCKQDGETVEGVCRKEGGFKAVGPLFFEEAGRAIGSVSSRGVREQYVRAGVFDGRTTQAWANHLQFVKFLWFGALPKGFNEV